MSVILTVPVPEGCDLGTCCCVIFFTSDSPIGIEPGFADVGGCCDPFTPGGECGGQASWETKVVDTETPPLNIKLWCGADDITADATWVLEVVAIHNAHFIDPDCISGGVDPTVTINSPTDPNSTVNFAGTAGLSGGTTYVDIRATATYHGVEYVYEFAFAGFQGAYYRVCIEGGLCP